MLPSRLSASLTYALHSFSCFLIIMPFMRKAGLYDHYCEHGNLWEFDERAANVYYELGRNDFARIVVPTRLFTSSETSFAPIPSDAGSQLTRSVHR